MSGTHILRSMGIGPTLLGFGKTLFRSVREMETAMATLSSTMGSEAVLRTLLQQHNWYCELVVRSKAAEILGHAASDKMISIHVTRVRHDTSIGLDEYHWDGVLLLRCSSEPFFAADKNTVGFHYWR